MINIFFLIYYSFNIYKLYNFKESFLYFKNWNIYETYNNSLSMFYNWNIFYYFMSNISLFIFNYWNVNVLNFIQVSSFNSIIKLTRITGLLVFSIQSHIFFVSSHIIFTFFHKLDRFLPKSRFKVIVFYYCSYYILVS